MESTARSKDICNKCARREYCSVRMEGDFWLGDCNYFKEKEKNTYEEATRKD